jgi:3-isopropylmalate/(R)-2-methylmalate dehydratase small subunit
VKPFTDIETPAIPLPLANVDTDQIIPARFMTRSRAEGYGACLLYDFRFDPDGAPRDNPLDDPRRAGAAVLIARRNFGCGSSREAAVYALADFGLRCIVAPSFGDIFASNAVKNGLLPARVSSEDAEALLASLAVAEGGAVRIDLAAQTISIGNLVASFEIDPVWKTQLLHGWDDVDFTLREQSRIEAFRTRDLAARPWAVPGALDFPADLQVSRAASGTARAKS